MSTRFLSHTLILHISTHITLINTCICFTPNEAHFVDRAMLLFIIPALAGALVFVETTVILFSLGHTGWVPLVRIVFVVF